MGRIPVWPLTLTVAHPIPEVKATSEHYLYVHPITTPEIIVCREQPMEPGRLYGWLLGHMMDGNLIPVDRPPASSTELIEYLQRAVGSLPLPARSSPRRRPYLTRVK